ncbi:plant cysteine oxidase 2-like [Curcuma longa]|uniref:plant cysteine oxidase 2-like n=1 Tax=Curcuma longa TaxID=136217 RepID=UPI003D9EA71F
MPSAVQRLFDTCKEVFADVGSGAVPSPADVERLRSVLDTLKPQDVGLSRNLPLFKHASTNRPPPVTYLHLSALPNFSIGIFCLPRTAVIPLHNHPGMTVFSKILVGSMHIKSYDWVTDPQSPNEKIMSPTGACLAKVNTDAVFKAPCETSILYPTTGGNIHRFTAVTPCAVLDVLGPPYNDNEGRACTYYKEHPYLSFPGAAIPGAGDGDSAWLEAMPSDPEELVVRGGQYTGPEIVDY